MVVYYPTGHWYLVFVVFYRGLLWSPAFEVVDWLRPLITRTEGLADRHIENLFIAHRVKNAYEFRLWAVKAKATV